MRILILLSFSLLLFQYSVSAQRKNYLDPGGGIPVTSLDASLSAGATRPSIYLFLNATFLFPEFSNGTIYFRNGDQLSARINYSVVRDKMYFINDKGDTLLFTDPISINYIEINKTKFHYFKHNYLQVIGSKAGITLAYRRTFKAELRLIQSADSVAAFELDKSTRRNYFAGEGQKLWYDKRMYAVVHESDYYYLGDKYGSFAAAGKNVFLHSIENEQQQVAKFMTAHKTDFHRLNDILELLQFYETIHGN